MDSSLLTPDEFDAHVAGGTFRLSFVGMSNAGKSYRSKVLSREKDFLWYQVDEGIQRALGFADMQQISDWLGLPSTDGYKERERQYLALEEECTRRASMNSGGKNFVFDTTGSVVNLGQETLDILRDNCLVVNLEVGEDRIGAMIEKFFIEPKPVAWGDFFTQQPGELADDALRRCYPLLLKERLTKYRQVAHITVPAAEVRDASGDQTLAVIRSYLG